MRKKTNNLIFPLLVMGVFFVFASSCKKGDGDIPVLSTTVVTEITQTTANGGGNITSDGGEVVTARGVCWSTNQTPTISDNKTTDGVGAGNFTSSINELTANTKYYVRAYATNKNGTGYGNEVYFTTQQGIITGSLTDSRDGTVYQTVKIGNQVWMAENLKYLPSVVGPATVSIETPYYYVYGYNGSDVNAAKATTNYSTYGVLYNWPAAMNGSASSTTNPSGVQGVCPAGWHLPSEAEWTELADYHGGTGVAGGKLKATGTVHWKIPNTGATNEAGFAALPGGRFYDVDLTFDDIREKGNWWSATQESYSHAWALNITYNFTYLFTYGRNKSVGISVRCVKN
jgi:uncharacterized protein (TIGR02145 family)